MRSIAAPADASGAVSAGAVRARIFHLTALPQASPTPAPRKRQNPRATQKQAACARMPAAGALILTAAEQA